MSFSEHRILTLFSPVAQSKRRMFYVKLRFPQQLKSSFSFLNVTAGLISLNETTWLKETFAHTSALNPTVWKKEIFAHTSALDPTVCVAESSSSPLRLPPPKYEKNKKYAFTKNMLPTPWPLRVLLASKIPPLALIENQSGISPWNHPWRVSAPAQLPAVGRPLKRAKRRRFDLDNRLRKTNECSGRRDRPQVRHHVGSLARTPWPTWAKKKKQTNKSSLGRGKLTFYCRSSD